MERVYYQTLTKQKVARMYDKNTLPPIQPTWPQPVFELATQDWMDRHSKNGIAHYTTAQLARAIKKITVDYYCEVFGID